MWECAGQLRICERACKDAQTAGDPCGKEQRRVRKFRSDTGRRSEDSATDGRSDQDGNGAEQSESALEIGHGHKHTESGKKSHKVPRDLGVM